MTPARILYLVLRGLTLCVALLLGLFILSAFIWVPFYASEGNTVQFQDRIRGLIGVCLFFIAIVTPYRWTVATPYYQIRMGMIIIAAAWMLRADTMAYSAGLKREGFPPSSWSANHRRRCLMHHALYATCPQGFRSRFNDGAQQIVGPERGSHLSQLD
jgi:hypothetical protein